MTQRTLSDRFWSKVVQSGDYWVWTGAIDKRSGYGRIQVNHSCLYAHRVSYELMVADIPEGLHIDHLCQTRACVNPFHLDPVPSAINTARSPTAKHLRTHCPQGHAYDGENLFIYTDKRGFPHRGCRTCRKEAMTRFHTKHGRAA